jgi:hypothetical protein
LLHVHALETLKYLEELGVVKRVDFIDSAWRVGDQVYIGAVNALFAVAMRHRVVFCHQLRVRRMRTDRRAVEEAMEHILSHRSGRYVHVPTSTIISETTRILHRGDRSTRRRIANVIANASPPWGWSLAFVKHNSRSRVLVFTPFYHVWREVVECG